MENETMDLKIGMNILVFWKEMNEWYKGIISDIDNEKGYFIKYEDGDQQWEKIENKNHISIINENKTDDIPDNRTKMTTAVPKEQTEIKIQNEIKHSSEMKEKGNKYRDRENKKYITDSGIFLHDRERLLELKINKEKEIEALEKINHELQNDFMDIEKENMKLKNVYQLLVKNVNLSRIAIAKNELNSLGKPIISSKKHKDDDEIDELNSNNMIEKYQSLNKKLFEENSVLEQHCDDLLMKIELFETKKKSLEDIESELPPQYQCKNEELEKKIRVLKKEKMKLVSELENINITTDKTLSQVTSLNDENNNYKNLIINLQNKEKHDEKDRDHWKSIFETEFAKVQDIQHEIYQSLRLYLTPYMIELVKKNEQMNILSSEFNFFKYLFDVYDTKNDGFLYLNYAIECLTECLGGYDLFLTTSGKTTEKEDVIPSKIKERVTNYLNDKNKTDKLSEEEFILALVDMIKELWKGK